MDTLGDWIYRLEESMHIGGFKFCERSMSEDISSNLIFLGEVFEDIHIDRISCFVLLGEHNPHFLKNLLYLFWACYIEWFW
jgi:hypothetical protein